MECPKCGDELEIRNAKTGTEENGESIYTEFAVCHNCRKKWNLERMQKKKEEQDLKQKTRRLVVGVVTGLAVLLVMAAAMIGKYSDRILPKEKEKVRVEKKEDGVIDFQTDTFIIKYINEEIGTDYEGNKCIFTYYDFTNIGKENVVPMAALSMMALQNGTECESSVITEKKEEIDNYMEEIEPGTTIRVAQAFDIHDMSDVEIQVSELISLNEKSNKQIIKLQ